MASLINPPLLDKTGKEIVAALTGEAVQPSESQYNAPISDATGKAILEAVKQGGGGGGSPVIVTADLQALTWSGATWAELYAAYQRNAAGMRVASQSGSYATFWAIAEGASDPGNHAALIIFVAGGASVLIVDDGTIKVVQASVSTPPQETQESP